MLAAAPAEAARKALVIGNGAYKAQPLANPVNDATAIAHRLEALGFEVVLATNATRAQMAVAILDFQKRLTVGDEAVVYYAGHGVQVGGVNYLMPVDAEPGSEAEVEYLAIDLDKILRGLNATGTSANLLLLDACRNNPFEQKFRGGGRGLARVESASGTLISYAAAPGTVAADGQGRNSPYADALLKALEQPGLTVEDLLKRVHVEVRQVTGGRQSTWQEGQIVGRLVLNPEKPKPVAAPLPAPPAFDSRLAEMKFWESADRDGSLAGYEAYLAQFPDGTFSALARARVAKLKAPVAAPAPVPPSRDIEMRFWDSADRGGSVAGYEAYLAQFPDGAFAALAKARITELRAASPRPPAQAAPPVAVIAPAVPAAQVPPAVSVPDRPAVPVPPPAVTTSMAQPGATPGDGEGIWEGVDERGEGTLVLERVGTRLKFHVKLGANVVRDAGDDSVIRCEDTDVPADGKVSIWCGKSGPVQNAQRLTGTFPNFRLTSAGHRYYAGGSYVLAPAAAPPRRPAQVQAAPAVAALPVPVPAAPPAMTPDATSPARGDGVWEADTTSGEMRLVVRRAGGTLAVTLLFLRTSNSGRTMREAGSSVDCDSATLSADGKLDAWCSSGSSRSRITGQYPRFVLSGPLAGDVGPFVVASAPTPGGQAADRADRAAPVPAAALTPTEARLAARMPANSEGVWEGTDEKGEASLTIRRSGNRVTAVVVVASGRGGPRGDGVIECEATDPPADGRFETWCGSASTWSFAQKLTGAHPVYRVPTGDRHYPGGTFTLTFRPSTEEAAQIAAEKAATGR
ncbi:MAG: caspase domain-containing protein [Alphaproteobacteria bacterium]